MDTPKIQLGRLMIEFSESMRDLVKRAVLAEREECARLCERAAEDKEPDETNGVIASCESSACFDCAALIRSRSARE